jgi:hypothetical protein
MSLVLDSVGPPPHLLHSRTPSWPCPYDTHQHQYPASTSSPAPMSPQSLQSYMSHVPESPLPSQEINTLPASSWYSPSVSAPECHSQVPKYCLFSLSPVAHAVLLEWLRRIWPIYASAYVVHHPVTAHFYLHLPGKAASIKCADRTISCSNVSDLRPCQGLSITRFIAPVRRTPVKPGPWP